MDRGTILTDVKDGDAALEPYLPRLTGKWEFIISGELSVASHHQWDGAYWIQRIPGQNVYALRLDDYGDPLEDDSDGIPEVKVVAVWVEPPYDDEEKIVCELLEFYMEASGKYIEFYHDMGRFKLDY